jgi:hypothetical protein
VRFAGNIKAGCTTKILVKYYHDWAYDKNTCPVRDKMLVEKLFHRLYSVPSGTLCEMEGEHTICVLMKKVVHLRAKIGVWRLFVRA